MNLFKEQKLNTEINLRRKKLKKLHQHGIAFPNDFRRNAISNQLHSKYDKKSQNDLKELKIEVSVAGRLIKKRLMGKAAFVILNDMGGNIQLYFSFNILNIYFNQFKTWDIGDIIGVSGFLFKTKTNELSIYCKKIKLLTKSIRPLPDKYHGLVDQETCYRQRYLDLIANKKSRKIFKIRSLIINEIRQFMIAHDFMEVETPMMQNIPGGATAKPFITHHNSLNIDMYLRIAPELYLKQLVIGGFERVFEINKNFRNEGLSPRHNSEFTMMELYMAYADYRDLIKLLEDLLRTISNRIFGSKIINYGNEIFNLDKPFNQMTMIEAILNYYPTIKQKDLLDKNAAINVAKSIGLIVFPEWGLGKIQSKIFEILIEHHLIHPTFITSYPVEVSPLARCSDINPLVTDRFELFIAGYEIGNGFSELNDPEEQSYRFKQQLKEKESTLNECNFYDQTYLTALEYGLPPTAGLGIGIDRLVMLFTNSQNIRDVILFPMLRPNK